MIFCSKFVTLSSILIVLSITSALGSGLKRTKYGCEGSTMEISCDQDQQIQILRANFGRFNNAICNEDAKTTFSLNCYQPKTLRIVKQRCENERKCQFPVDTDMFGEPCPGTSKYIEVHYTCAKVNKESSHSSEDAKPLAPWLLDLSATPPTISTTTEEPLPTTTSNEVQDNTDEEDSLLSFQIEEEIITFPDEESEEFENEEIIDFPEEPVGHCPPITERGIFWNWTRSGVEAVNLCPPGSTGFARWRCQTDGHWSAEFPNLSNCQSNWIRRLDPEVNSITYLLSKLDQYTSSRPLYGGDIPFVVRLLQVLPERLGQDMTMMQSQEEKEFASFELQQKVSKIASDLLEDIQMLAWQDLEQDKRAKLVSGIFLGVIESNLVMADILNREKRIRFNSGNVMADVRVKGARHINDQYMNDEDTYILITDDTLAEASINGAVRVGFFTFKNLEYILPGMDNYFINSEIVGSAISNVREENLSSPVTFSLRHKLSYQEAKNPVCVAWNYRSNAWSSDSCIVKETNPTHTTCECNKLSQYAILMEPLPTTSAEPQSSKFDTFEKVDVILVISFLLASSILLLSLALIIAKRRKLGSVCCFSKSKQSCQNSDSFYPPLTSSSSTAFNSQYQSSLLSRPHHHLQQPNNNQEQNGPSIIYQMQSQSAMPFKSDFCGHIYSEISQPSTSSAATYLSYLNEGSETSSNVSSEMESQNVNNNISSRGSPTFLPLLRQNHCNSSLRQQQSQATLMPYHHHHQQQHQAQPLAITLQDGNQFVRLKMEDPYTIEPIGLRLN